MLATVPSMRTHVPVVLHFVFIVELRGIANSEIILTGRQNKNENM
jgi:hypothetical protein